MPEPTALPAATSPTTGSVTGVVRGWRLGVDGAHRVAVHRGVVEAGQRDVGDDLLGQQQALGVEQRQLDRIDRADRLQYPGQLLGDRTQRGRLRPAARRG